MDSDILRWLLLIVAAIVLFIWYLSHLFVSRRSGSKLSKFRGGENDSVVDQPSTLLGESSKSKDANSEQPSSENLIILSVDCRNEREFNGADVVDKLKARGLKFGKYSIYHRYIQSEGSEKLVYSVINGVEPGHLDDDFIDATTPSVMFFIDVDKSHNPLRAFSEMLETAKDIAVQLGGVACDSYHNQLTEQTIGYMRDQISEQERNRQLRTNY